MAFTRTRSSSNTLRARFARAGFIQRQASPSPTKASVSSRTAPPSRTVPSTAADAGASATPSTRSYRGPWSPACAARPRSRWRVCAQYQPRHHTRKPVHDPRRSPERAPTGADIAYEPSPKEDHRSDQQPIGGMVPMPAPPMGYETCHGQAGSLHDPWVCQGEKPHGSD